MDEGDVGRIAVVVHALKEIAGPFHRGENLEHAFFLHMPVAWKWWRFTVAKISEDQTEIFPRRAAWNPDFLRERFFLGRLLDALAGFIENPTMINAADAVPFDPAGRELRSPVGTAEPDHVRRAALAAIESEALAHDLNRFGLAGHEIFGAMDGMPEPAHISSREASWLG